MSHEKCPKCGAEPYPLQPMVGTHGMTQTVWQCHSRTKGATFYQSGMCKDAQLAQVAAELEKMKAIHQRVCPCGCIVSGPTGHPCVKCGDTSQGRHVAVVLAQVAAERDALQILTNHMAEAHAYHGYVKLDIELEDELFDACDQQRTGL